MTVIRTTALEIVNSAGSVVIRLGSDCDGNPMIELLDSCNDISRMTFTVNGDRTSLGLLDIDGSTLVGIGAEDGKGGISILDKSNGRIRLISSEE